MSGVAPSPGLYLAPTEFIESTAPAVVALAAQLREATPAETGRRLFLWVRDQILYDAMGALEARPQHRASATLARRRGFCVQKAVLLAALARAAGIPARLGFADVRNHKAPLAMRRLMGTDLFVFHGFVELLLGERWLKATPAFDRGAAERSETLPLEFDGRHDAVLPPRDPEGRPFIEYVRDRGTYPELPFDEMMRTLRATYGGGRPEGNGATSG